MVICEVCGSEMVDAGKDRYCPDCGTMHLNYRRLPGSFWKKWKDEHARGDE